MAGPALPTNRTTASTIAEHVADHNAAHNVVNKIDKDATPSSGQVLKWNGSVYVPATDLTGSVDNVLTGVVGDNSTDNSSAFATAYAAVASAAVAVSGFTNERGRKVIELPAGHFKIVSPGSLMSDLSIPRASGLTIRGAGREMTTIVFSPSTADQYLMDNNDDWLNIHFEDLTFHSTVATASFMKSTSSGGAQNYTFSRVNWNGTWKYGIHMIGSNVNSEMTWLHCSVQDNWTAFLYSDAGTGSDQFLNYNFFACQIEYTTGNFIDMAKGGNINVVGGSFIHTGTGSVDQVFFKLRTGDHASGVQRLHVQGIRVEHRHIKSKLLESEWKRGVITFDNCDFEAHAFILGSASTLPAVIVDGGGDTMPQIAFRDCVGLFGKHSYLFNVGSWNRRRLVIYDNCEFALVTSAHDFLTIVNSGGTGNLGGTPPIKFRDCRALTTDSYLYPFDCTVNWELAKNATPERHQVSIKTPEGSLPNVAAGAHEVWLPKNSVVTNVRFYKPAGGTSSSTTFTYLLKDSQGAPVTVASAAPGTAWNAGFSVNADTFYLCDTDAKRHLQLTATVITEMSNAALCVVTYLA